MNTEPRIVKVSPHLLMDQIACQTKSWTRHVKGRTSANENIKAVAGQAIHAAIANYLVQLEESAPGTIQKETSLATFHHVYDPAYARLDAAKLDPGMTPQNLHRILDRWIEMHPKAAMPWQKVLTVEEAFVSRKWHLKDPSGRIVEVQLIVRPDAVVVDMGGKVRWVDTKTTGWHITDAGWKLDLKLSFQAQLYSDAVAQRYGTDALYAGWFSAMELRKLPGDPDAAPKLKKDGTPAKPTKCQDHGVPYAVCGHEHAKAEFIEAFTTPERVLRAVLDAKAAAQEYVNMLYEQEAAEAMVATDPLIEKSADEAIVPHLNMKGTAKGVCRFCPASGWCDSNRPAAEGALDGFFIYEPYPVEVGMRAEVA